jgi:hypothetical protein
MRASSSRGSGPEMLISHYAVPVWDKTARQDDTLSSTEFVWNPQTNEYRYLKRILKLDRLRLRGPGEAHDEFLMAATEQSLRRMAIRLMADGEQNGIAIA